MRLVRRTSRHFSFLAMLMLRGSLYMARGCGEAEASHRAAKAG